MGLRLGLLLLAGSSSSALAASHLDHGDDESHEVPVRGSGRLVKQVASPPKKSAKGPPQQHQARVAVTVPALLARSHPAWENTKSLPTIDLWHITSHATFHLRPDLKGGGFSPRQMKELSYFLRCHYTNTRHSMDQRLISLVYATARHYKNAKIHIISGYRAPSVALAKGNPKSPHKRGVACDFQVEGVPIIALRDYLRGAYHHIGVGYYPNSGFIHLDVGRQQDAYWIDYSSPGQKARYSPGPGDVPGGAQEAANAPDPAGSPEATKEAAAPLPPPPPTTGEE